MSPLDADLVRRKLAIITRNLDDLAPVAKLNLEAYREDRFRQKGSERLLQEAIEAAVDANLHLLRSAGAPTPADYYRSFIELGMAGLIPTTLAERLAPAAGLRNRLVHEYDEIDDAMVLRSIDEAQRGFAEYVRWVEDYLTKQGL